MSPRSPEATEIKESDLIIIDEASMMTKHTLKCIHLLLCDITNNKSVPFGGKVVVLSGDFRQTLPVIPKGGKSDILEASIKYSPLWSTLTKLELTENLRIRNSNRKNNWQKWLLKVGNGEKLHQISTLPENVIPIPEEMITEKDIVNKIFGQEINTEEVEALAGKVILTPRNDTATNINNEVIKKIKGKEVHYYSSDSIDLDSTTNATYFPIEFLNSEQPSGMPPHHLILKEGVIVILLRNLQPNRGLCNGTRLTINKLYERFVDATIITGSHKGERVFIPRIDLTPTETFLPFQLRRRQLPILPAFAITINRSQGQSFEHVGIYLPQPVFAHGQLYVALSRGTDPDNITIFIKTTTTQGRLIENVKQLYTPNIVYHEILKR